jgi:soluble lytic murein transglycosylase-like protein
MPVSALLPRPLARPRRHGGWPPSTRAALVCGLLAGAALLAWAPQAQAQLLPPTLPTLDGLPRPSTPPAEKGPVVPARVERWRQEAKALEYGEGVPRDPVRAAELYCRAARHGDAEAQYSLAWMMTNSRGIERNEAEAAHLFAAAAEQGYEQAKNILARMGGEPRGAPPPCLRPPEEDQVAAAPPPAPPRPQPGAQAGALPTVLPVPPPAHAPEPIVRFVNLVAPEYKLQPHLVLSIIATESNFDASAVSPKDAHGLMQLIPGTAARFGVRNILDPVQNIRGGMAYLRWLMARFEGDLTLVSAAYNAGEGAVERYLGVPPFAETRLYVLKIRAGVAGQRFHPFDATAAEPSPLMAAIKAAQQAQTARR